MLEGIAAIGIRTSSSSGEGNSSCLIKFGYTSAYAASTLSWIVLVPVHRHEACEVLYSRPGR